MTSLDHVRARLALVRERTARLVEHRRGTDAQPDDDFRGLYISDAQAGAIARPRSTRHLPFDDGSERDRIEGRAGAADVAGEDGLRLRRVAAAFGLDEADVDVLLAALLPDVDQTVERLYGYLNDDVSRRRASVELALLLAGVDPSSADGRRRVGPRGPLVDGGLLTVTDDRPYLTRELAVPDAVTSYLLGADTLHPSVAACAVLDAAVGGGDGHARLFDGDASLHLRGRPWTTARAAALDALGRRGRPALVLDAGRIAATADPPAVARAARRDARLRGWWLVVGAIDDLDAAVMRTLADGDRVVLVGQGRWDPAWSTEAPPTVEIGPMAPAARRAQWSQALGDRLDDVAGLSTFVLDGDAIRRSVAMAERLAAMEGVPLAAAHVAAGARAQNGNTLDRLARRIEPEVGLDDMVLKPQVRSLLEDVIGRARHRDVVLDQWRMRPGGGRGRGVTALFAGEPGTGKTMGAEAVARELGLDLYAIDLASVVDKYIGETEKNLERIFAAAEGLNAVLLFDEADALFGKRSEVSDAHDRHANIEVAYLLQRMESFDGLAVLSTNMRANIDEAFARRLDVVVEFTTPDAAQRRQLWATCLRPLPLGDDVDLDACAHEFEISGGNIRAVAVSTAYRLAARGAGAVTMQDLLAATEIEYRKMGRLVRQRTMRP